MASINLQGDTSGAITISAPSVAGSNTLTLPATTQTLATQNALGVRNLIINGDMRIDQRNAGASVTPTNAQYLTDRFSALLTQASKFTAQQSSTTPSNFTKSLLLTSSSAYTVLSGDAFGILQKIEGNNIAHLGWGTANAQTVTLSFYVRSSLTGTFGGALLNESVTRSYPFTYTIDSANTWERKSITISGDTTGTWDTDNTLGIQIHWGLGVGSTYSGTANTWAGAYYLSSTGATSVVGTSGATLYITGVQLEVGDTATPFEHRPYDMELARCQRYYEKSYAVTTAPAGSDPFVTNVNPLNRGGGVGAVGYPIYYRVTKRANPTVTPYTYDGTSGQWHTGVIGSSEAKGNATIEDAGTNYFKVVVLYSTTPNAMYGHWVSSAEL